MFEEGMLIVNIYV
jgi:hypothetical protein